MNWLSNFLLVECNRRMQFQAEENLVENREIQIDLNMSLGTNLIRQFNFQFLEMSDRRKRMMERLLCFCYFICPMKLVMINNDKNIKFGWFHTNSWFFINIWITFNLVANHIKDGYKIKTYIDTLFHAKLLSMAQKKYKISIKHHLYTKYRS